MLAVNEAALRWAVLSYQPFHCYLGGQGGFNRSLHHLNHIDALFMKGAAMLDAPNSYDFIDPTRLQNADAYMEQPTPPAC